MNKKISKIQIIVRINSTGLGHHLGITLPNIRTKSTGGQKVVSVIK